MFDGGGNRFQNSLAVDHHVMVVEAQNTKALAGKKGISPRVASLLF